MCDTITCVECGDETDASKYATCSCSKCKNDFCSSFKKDCFAKFHRKKKDCHGTCLEITNPQWICNLVKNLQKEDHAV